MKKVFMYLSLSLILYSCDNDDNDYHSTNVPLNASTPEAINDFLTNTEGLIVTNFREDGVSKTNLFSGFVFVFNESGSITAMRNSDTILGNYSIFLDDGKIELAMVFPIVSGFFELTDDWYFVSKTQNEIIFADEDDLIQFQQQ
jgi:hypothetical protein